MTNLIDRIFDRNVDGIQKTLDLTWKRNEAISSNLANAETPTYRAVDVTFAGELDRAFGVDQSTLTKTDGRHMDVEDRDASHLVADFSGRTRADGNNVDLDIQMGKMARNAGKYTLATQMMQKKMMIIKNAIRFSMR